MIKKLNYRKLIKDLWGLLAMYLFFVFLPFMVYFFTINAFIGYLIIIHSFIISSIGFVVSVDKICSFEFNLRNYIKDEYKK